MNPDETIGDLETASAVDDDQQFADDDQDADEAFQEEQADPQDSETEDSGESSEPSYTVTIDGQDRQLSKSELEKSLMLHKAFTQKSQTLAEEKRQWEAGVSKAREALGREVESVKGWLEFYQANQPQEPDWAALAETSPADYVRQKAKWDAEAGKRAQAQQMYQQIRQRDAELQQERFVSDLYTEFPEWRDQSAMVRDLGDIYLAAGQYGYTQDDVHGIMDPRQFKVLQDAAKWRNLQAKKTEVQARVTDAPKKPPLRATAPARSGLAEQIKKLSAEAKNGSMEAAAEVMRLRQRSAMNGTTRKRV